MDKVLIRYQGNGSSRYTNKVYFESESKLRREKSARGPLRSNYQDQKSHLEGSCSQYQPQCTSKEEKETAEKQAATVQTCSKDLGIVPVPNSPLKVKPNNSLLAVRCQNHLEINH